MDTQPGAELQLRVEQTEGIAPHKRKDGSDYPPPPSCEDWCTAPPRLRFRTQLFTVFSLPVATALWGQASDLPADLPLSSEPPPRAVYEVVAEPVAFGTELHGLVQVDTRVEISTGDELEQLGGAFNRMVEGSRERGRLRRTFERHVSKEVAAELLRHPEALAPRGERREVTVLFSDLAGFTTFSEQRPPEEILACLNEYFAVLCDVVLAAGGTVNELLGDGVLAVQGPADGATRSLLERAWRFCDSPPPADWDGILALDAK